MRQGWVAGVDGCRAGWFVVLLDTPSGRTQHRLVEHFRDLLGQPEKPEFVAVDMPIGLLDHAAKGGRECDREARRILGQPRARSVFSPHVRSALRHTDYTSANEANKASSPERIGISKQSFGLRSKLLEVDQFMTPYLQDRVREVHPELSFYELNGRQAVSHGKKNRAGLLERQRLLLGAGFRQVISEVGRYPRTKVADDDIADACAACWTAVRILEGKAIRIPADPPRESCDLRMEIWR